MKRALLAAAMTLVAALGTAPAHADDPTCTVAGGSATAAHLQDPAGDWSGTATGDGQGLPYGDVYRDASDVTNSWLAPGGPKGVQAHVQLSTLMGTETNMETTFQWVVTDDAGASTLYYVSAAPNGTGGAAYDTGQIAPDPTTGVNTLTSLGATTGKMVTGTPGEFIIDVPKALFQKHTVGSGVLLESPLVETRFLLGARGAGLLELLDDTTNADPACSDGITL